MKLIYVFRILYRKKWIILGCAGIALIAAFIFTMNEKRSYRSIAQLETGFTDTRRLQLLDEQFSLSQIDVKFNNAITEMLSAKMISLLSYKLVLNDLTATKPFRQQDPDVLKKEPALQSVNKQEMIRAFLRKSDSILILNPGIAGDKTMMDFLASYGYDMGSIKEHLSVTRNQRTDFINIVFRSENPDLSAYAVNMYTKEFLRYNDQINRDRSQESSVALDSLARRKKKELDDKIAAKAQYLADSVSSTLDPTLVSGNLLGQISQIESGLADEQARVQDLTYQLQQIETQLLTSKQPVVTTRPTQGDGGEYLRLRKEYYDLKGQYQAGGSSDADLKRRMDEAYARMNAAKPDGSNTGTNDNGGFTQTNSLQDRKISLEGQLRSARFKIGQYSGKLGQLNAQLRNANPNSISALDRYDKDIEVAQLDYQTAKDKQGKSVDQAELSSTYHQNLFGQPAVEPEASKRLVVMALAALTGLLLSSLVFILMSYIDQSIKTPSQFQRQTELKLIGTVSMIDLKHGHLAEQVTQIEEEDAKRDNSFRELLRKLRYEIERTGKRVILFTSTEPQQGKTTLTQALAFSLHLSKKRVLIIDTNFCNNDITQLNNAHPTLEDFRGNGELKPSDYEKMVTKTGVEYVDIIGCKGGDYTPTEILPKNHLLNYLPDLLKEYDYVFMEAAPLNGFTDTKELVQYAEGVIAIFAATAEVKQADKDSIRFFHDIKGKFIGAILNKVGKADMNL